MEIEWSHRQHLDFLQFIRCIKGKKQSTKAGLGDLASYGFRCAWLLPSRYAAAEKPSLAHIFLLSLHVLGKAQAVCNSLTPFRSQYGGEDPCTSREPISYGFTESRTKTTAVRMQSNHLHRLQDKRSLIVSPGAVATGSPQVPGAKSLSSAPPFWRLVAALLHLPILPQIFAASVLCELQQ